MIGRGAQPAGAAPRSDGPRRDDRHHPGRRVAEQLAAGRLHAVRDARALPDVRRGDSCRPAFPRSSTGRPIPRPARSQRCTGCWATPRLNHRCQVVPGVLAEPCGADPHAFFQQQRGWGRSSRSRRVGQACLGTRRPTIIDVDCPLDTDYFSARRRCSDRTRAATRLFSAEQTCPWGGDVSGLRGRVPILWLRLGRPTIYRAR